MYFFESLTEIIALKGYILEFCRAYRLKLESD